MHPGRSHKGRSHTPQHCAPARHPSIATLTHFPCLLDPLNLLLNLLSVILLIEQLRPHTQLLGGRHPAACTVHLVRDTASTQASTRTRLKQPPDRRPAGALPVVDFPNLVRDTASTKATSTRTRLQQPPDRRPAAALPVVDFPKTYPAARTPVPVLRDAQSCATQESLCNPVAGWLQVPPHMFLRGLGASKSPQNRPRGLAELTFDFSK